MILIKGHADILDYLLRQLSKKSFINCMIKWWNVEGSEITSAAGFTIVVYKMCTKWVPRFLTIIT